MIVAEVRRLKQLEEENRKLKQLVADLSRRTHSDVQASLGDVDTYGEHPERSRAASPFRPLLAECELTGSCNCSGTLEGWAR